jgi:hypothetical protein
MDGGNVPTTAEKRCIKPTACEVHAGLEQCLEVIDDRQNYGWTKHVKLAMHEVLKRDMRPTAL